MAYSDRLLWECHDYVENNCVKTKSKSVQLKSGKKSAIYYDIKDGIVRDSYFATSICSVIDSTLNNNDIKYDTVAGVALGGVLISDRFIQYKHFYNRITNRPSLNYLVIRNLAKNHGLAGVIIGNHEDAENVVMIEDVITSGESVQNAIDALKEGSPDINISAIISIVDRTDWFYS